VVDGGIVVSSGTRVSTRARTQFLEVKGGERYAYRRFGSGSGHPLLLLQHFTGTLDNWDPALTDALAGERELILFDNAGIGRSSGSVPTTVDGMATHAAAFLDGLGVETCDVLGFSLGGMVAQRLALDRPATTLVVNGVHDEMIPVVNSYHLVENLPNAVLLTYPDAGHGSLFQYHDSFARQAGAFLSVTNESAVY
jgi:pimeloyl-ACP methyl ester carboxylesterase